MQCKVPGTRYRVRASIPSGPANIWLGKVSSKGMCTTLWKAGHAGISCYPTVAGRLRGFSSRAIIVNYAGPTANELLSMRSEEHTSELQSLLRTQYAVLCSKKNMY